MKKFEDKLKLLFDAQDFFREPSLDAFIKRETLRSLSDDEVEFLFAAGDPFREVDKENDGME